MLIIDGVKYKLWTPKDEEKEFHPMIKKYSKEIFGEDSLYFDIKHILKTISGIGTIPDAYVICLSRKEWYVVENELASHPIYDHIVKQLTKFINGIENQNTKNQIIDMLYDEINNDIILKATVQKKLGPTDTYHFLSKLISKLPTIVIVIDQKTPEIIDACRALKYQPHIIEFKTFIREDAANIHANLFEPLYEAEETIIEEVVRPELPIISRKELASLKEGIVVICPSKPEGVNFLLQHNAWGFVRIRRKPEYFALYLSHPESKILFFGEVEDVLYPKDSESPLTEEEARSYKEFKEGKKIIVLKPGSLRKLDKGIPKGTAKRGRLQGLKYATLTKFTNARTLDDL
jgi:hypothetical protein